MNSNEPKNIQENKHTLETATLAGGCFWCTEAIFTRIHGVVSVVPGYTGGTDTSPTYEHVCMGTTGHAEAVQILYQSNVVSYTTLLDVFFATHDPTTKNKQGADVGTQYRSVIYYHSIQQKKIAEEKIAELVSIGTYTAIVTEVLPSTTFYRAEEYHRQYFEKNSNQPYCQLIIDPKIKKLLTTYQPFITPSYQ